MKRNSYTSPIAELISMTMTEFICQSLLGDTGTGSLGFDGNSGTDPDGSGDDFSWGN